MEILIPHKITKKESENIKTLPIVDLKKCTTGRKLLKRKLRLRREFEL